MGRVQFRTLMIRVVLRPCREFASQLREFSGLNLVSFNVWLSKTLAGRTIIWRFWRSPSICQEQTNAAFAHSMAEMGNKPVVTLKTEHFNIFIQACLLRICGFESIEHSATFRNRCWSFPAFSCRKVKPENAVLMSLTYRNFPSYTGGLFNTSFRNRTKLQIFGPLLC